MAEPSKKHSRKSKLVPRECIEIEDVVATSAELEEAVQSIPSSEPSTSLLPKIKNTINEDSFKRNSSTPVELSVQVQVESCSDDDQEESGLYNDDDDKYILKQMKMIAKLPKREIIIYPDTILTQIDKTAQKIKTAADKQLDIFIRNSLVRNIKVFELDHYESLLQEVLSQWRVWMCLSKTRGYVLAFKCNICYQGWWNLQPFEDHIRIHKNITLRLETYHHDCVITAANGEWYESMCLVRIEGNCPRCLKCYESHTKTKRTSMYYICVACGDRFPTCEKLFNHEGLCVRYEKIVYANGIPYEDHWRCDLCDTNCLTEERYMHHYLGCHDVRSDEPVNVQSSRDCNQCGIKYFVYNLHVCPKRNGNFKCSYCFRKFQNKFLQYTHETYMNSSCYCSVCNKYLKKQCMLYEHLVRHSSHYVIAFKCQECHDSVLVATESLLSAHKTKYHGRKHDKRNFYETMIVPKQCLSLKFSEPVNITDMVIDKKSKSVSRTDTNKEVLEALTKIMQVRKEYTDSVDREKQLAKEERERAEQQEQQDVAVKNISKELANKFIKRANNLQAYCKYENEVDTAVDSLKLETNDSNSNDVDDYLTVDDDFRIDDDDIGETENSVNALLNQFNIKQEIDIEEPDLPHYMNLDDTSREYSKQNENDDEVQAATDIIVKSELMCYDTIETEDVNTTHTITVKHETADPQMTVVEDSQESDATETKVPETVQTNDLDENTNTTNYDTNITIKQEPVDSDETETELSKNITPENEKSLKQNEIELVEKHEMEIKEEKVDYEEFVVRIEDDIEREQNACLEELSKVFNAAETSKEVKLSKICVDELKVKDEPMDTDNEDFEQDLIITNTKQTFEVTIQSDTLNKSDSDKNDEPDTVDPSEPEVKISKKHNKISKASTSEQYNYKKRLYSCNKCDFTGEHRSYMAHVQVTCPRMSKNSRSFKKEIWTDMKCTKCDTKFLTLRKYLTHLTKIHCLNYNTCPQCSKVFRNTSATLTHLTMHIKKGFVKIQVLKELAYYSSQLSGVHQCKVCNEEVFYKNFFSHWESHQELKFEEDDEERDLVIDESGVEIDIQPMNLDAGTGDLKKVLEQLQMAVDDREVNLKRCCACDRNFDRRNDCKRHLIEHLLKAAYDAPGRGLVCQLCRETFEKPDNYKVHMRQHGSLPVFKCEMCNKCFSDSSNFAKHKKVHNLQAMQCDTCKRKFQSKNQLAIHMELHRTTNPIKCDICQRVFSLPSEYKKHVRSNHFSRGGVGYCRICRKRENTKRDLWEHMWQSHRVRHNDADCLICDKSFRKYMEVRAHMRLAHNLHTNVTIKTLRNIRALSATERAEKIRELLSTTVTVDCPDTDETFVIYE